MAVTDGVPWVVRAVEVLRGAGVDPVIVVVGAAADDVATLVPGTMVVRNDDWDSGMGGSLRAGLTAAVALPASITAMVVMLIDLPGITSEMVRRLVAHDDGDLVQASFDGKPGHPVLLGRAHWAGVAAAAHGDTGARDYLREHGAVRVPLGSAADGADVDTASP